MSESPPEPARILIVKLSSLGDLFHALPTVHNLRVATGATIDWVVQDSYVDLVRCFRDVDRVVPFSRHNFVGRLPAFWRDLRAREYDWVVDLQGLLKSAVPTWMARGRQRIGPSFHREGSRLFYHAVAGNPDRGRHIVDQLGDVIGHLGLEPIAAEFPVDFPSVELEGEPPRIGLAPKSRWETKDWPIESFASAASALQERVGGTIYLLGGPEDRQTSAAIASRLAGRAVVDLTGTTSLVEMGGALAAMDLVIANDSGPLHMAVAAGTPVVAAYGATDPARTGPYGQLANVLTEPLPCRPCLSRTCRVGGIPCLGNLDSDRVVERAVEIIGT